MTLLRELGVTDEQIEAFCKKWKIIEFALFGSAVRNELRPESDIDVLVSYSDDADWYIADLLEMQDELAALFARPVDIVTRKLVEKSANYIRRKAILSSAQTVYAESR